MAEDLKSKFDKLVLDFRLKSYKNLNETQTRLSFIDKFWNYLGWEVSNVEQVQVEVTDKQQKRPDYRFLKNKKTAFFVEAKKPAEDLKNFKHIYQTKLYCWNGNVPLAILTDFEEFRPFRAIGKPNLNDGNKGIIKQFDITYEAYPDLAYDLLNAFGREAVMGGSLESLVKPTKIELRDTVDKHFLETLSGWRIELATLINKNNNFANEFELSEAVQRILDRLVFLRILQDREIETEDFIKTIYSNKVNDAYSSFVNICKKLTPKYNGLIFNPHPLSENLKVETGLFKKIVKELDFEESPYRFDELPVETLGTIYERFLGSEIGFDKKGKITIDEKPEVRKAGGVYYTPQYIVEYIVQNTVGKLLYGDRGTGVGELRTEIGDRVKESKYSNDKFGEIEDGRNKNLQGFGTLERSDESNRNDLSDNKEISERGDLWVDESNPESGSFDTLERSRGTRQNSYEGIPISPVSGERLISRTGNPINTIPAFELHNSGADDGSMGKSQSHWQTSKRTSKSIKKSPLTSSDPHSPTSDPRPPCRTPEDVAKLKILDPACGSGSFLLGAFDILIKWHEDYFSANPAKALEKQNKQSFLLAYLDSSGQTKLTARMKGKILKNNIFGVDLDKQATEVAQMSLFIKCLEGMANEKLEYAFAFKEAILPKMEDNIKCGNSLIGTDFIQDDFFGLSEREKHKINPFDWEEEFPEVWGRGTENGGFDAVIGNPPWVSLTGKFGNDILNQEQINYLIHKFDSNTYMPNLYEYFISQGFYLTNINGYFSLIVPDRFGYNSQFINLRKKILQESKIITLLYKAKFPNITADTLIFLLYKNKDDLQNHKINISEYELEPLNVLQNDILKNETYAFEYFTNSDFVNIFSKIEKSNRTNVLINIIDSTSGFGGKSTLITKDNINPNQIKTMKGDSITRYFVRKIYWFEFKKENITGRTTDKSKLGSIKKILIRKTGDSIIAAYDESGIFPEQSLYFLFNNKTDMHYLFILGLINSQLLNFYYNNKLLTNKKSIAQVKKVDLDRLPIHNIDFTNPKEKAQHDKMVELVEKMLKLHKDLQTAGEFNRKHIEQYIKNTDKEIDSLVYELYGLTKEEIRIVEGG